jgi:hypothetical protein
MRVAEEGEPYERDEARQAGSKDRVAEVLEAAGFVDGEGPGVRLKGTGMSVHDVVADATGGRWVIELGGAFVRHRGGLTTADAVWRTLGRAHALRGAGERVLVLTSELPRRRSEFDLALRAAGSDAVFDIIDVFDADALDRLARYAGGHTEPLPGFWD